MKFFLIFSVIIAACSASGLIGYGAPLVAAPIATKVIAPAYAPVTSVTARQDIYGAKVIAAPVLAAPAYVAGPAIYGKGLGYGLGAYGYGGYGGIY